MLRNALIFVFTVYCLFDVHISAAHDYSWTGVWNTKYGVMTLKTNNGTVEGTYTHDGGRIVGTAAGDLLVARWDEAPTRKGPKDAGQIEFIMSADGLSFTGKWNYDGDGIWRNNWTGTRTSAIDVDPAACKAAKRKAKNATKKIADIKRQIRKLSEGGRTPSPRSKARLSAKLAAAKSKHAALKAAAEAICL